MEDDLMPDYKYDITDTVYNCINIDLLWYEVAQSSIEQEPEEIEIKENDENDPLDDEIKFKFHDDLAPEEHIALNNLVTLHDGYATVPPPQLDLYYKRDFGKISLVSQSSTISKSYIQHLRLDFPYLNSGIYKVSWSYEWRLTGTTSYDFKARLQVDNSDTIMENRQEPKNGGSDQWHQSSGFGYIGLEEGSHFFDLDYCRSHKGTAYIRRAHIEVWGI